MIETSRRSALLAGASAVGIALAGCLSDGTESWETDEVISVTAATMYSGPSCDCCDVYAEYLEDSLTTNLETVVPEDIVALKDDRGIETGLRSCHTVELDDYLVEGHVPAETVAMLLEDEPDISGIALPGMPAGSPGMGGTKDETWTVYEIRPGDEPAVYTEL
ncbi:metal-binding protein [Halobacteria archaeon AArc-curdl1]|uniref:Metal-binding protein n=1 Tax=Natronosalvus hydrolyticus TaxID=2979988 RepID=A0AAP3E5G3_9EURY|nr:metal-binding protein [Halobacteria archaeon AArc-curdl1]